MYPITPRIVEANVSAVPDGAGHPQSRLPGVKTPDYCQTSSGRSFRGKTKIEIMPTEIARPTLDLTKSAPNFPSLSQTINNHPAAFLDGPGGTQVPQRVIDAISNYLRRDNANTGGAYATSRNTDAMLAEARAAMADFLNCAADEIVFGPNMTTLTYAISRALSRDQRPRLRSRRRNPGHASRSRRQRFPLARARGTRRHHPLGRNSGRRLHARSR